jgi:peroxiredoxin Q/BCP
MAKKKLTKKKTAPKKVVQKGATKKASPKKVQKKATAKKPSVKKLSVKKPLAKKPAKEIMTSESFLKVGNRAPAFKAVNENGEPVSLESLRGKITVLYFYPKDDTPGCTKEACDFRDSFARLESEGIRVIGVSKDSPASHQKFRTKYQLPFSLISDESGQVCEAFGVWKEKSMYGRKYMGIERSTIVIDSELKISRVYSKVSVTGHVDEVLADIRALRER